MLNINELIKQSEEEEADRQEYLRQMEREQKRARTLQEAQAQISTWKKRHKRKKKTHVSISIAWEYNEKLDRSFYYLRLFVGGDLVSIYNLEEVAGKELIAGVQEDTYGRNSFFNLYNNQKNKL